MRQCLKCVTNIKKSWRWAGLVAVIGVLGHNGWPNQGLLHCRAPVSVELANSRIYAECLADDLLCLFQGRLYNTSRHFSFNKLALTLNGPWTCPPYLAARGPELCHGVQAGKGLLEPVSIQPFHRPGADIMMPILLPDLASFAVLVTEMT